MWLDYLILGTLQGIFEWLPISSQGIVAIASQFLIEDVNPLEVSLFLHLGTLFAVLIYFRNDWLAVLRMKDIRLLRFLIISTIFSVLVGLPLFNLIKDVAVGNSLLLVTGFGLLATAFFHKKKKKSYFEFKKLAVFAGILQGMAVIPGFSRSGATIFGLSLGDLSPKEILKFSYMMSAPVVLGGSVFLAYENPYLILETWPALIFSFLVGILSLKFLMKFSQKIDFFKFALIFALLCFIGAGIDLLY